MRALPSLQDDRRQLEYPQEWTRALPLGRLAGQDVPLERGRSPELAAGGLLESLGRAAMRFQFLLCHDF